MSGLVCLAVLVTVAVVCAEGGMPTSLMRMLDRGSDAKPETAAEDNFWGLAKDSPIRQELEQDPGIPLGRLANDAEVASVRESLRRGDFGRFRPSSGDDAAARRSLAVASDWSQFTPPPLKQVECHVEFQVTQRVPGRCTKLGGTIPACQNEKYIGINYSDCS